MITGALMSANWIPRPKIEDETVESSLTSSTSAIYNKENKDSKDSNNNNEANGRSAALERAYVHDVYENCEEPIGPIRPKVAQFLANLDPGSLVCDVGCGNGRYLTAACNPSIYSIGVDRCYRLAKVARSKGGEVAICDNLDLPFRDESFDAVLSLAVVHHFATTERRVGAIQELARILRIGGRVIITVWALEQKSRRFESQDVLIPWQPPKTKTNNTSDDEDDDDYLPPYHAYTYNEDSTNSSRSAGDGDSSSLSSSSPSDTCYSFVRRALQKLAGGKKSPWFLDSWNSKDTKNDSSLDYEDAKDLPIELRRLEDFDDIPEPPLSAGLKSRSLGSILNPPPKQIVRSRSSVPSLGSAHIIEPKQSHSVEPIVHSSSPIPASTSSQPNMPASRRPKLIKQKQSLCEDMDFPFANDTNPNSHYKELIRNDSRTQLLRKQSSLNEELMAESRIREKERIRKRIQKQMSLNETFLCRSIFTKRLQVIREGFTTKLKTSTGSLERVTKNGLVKIMQNIKSASNANHHPMSENTTSKPNETKTMKNGPLARNLSNGGCGANGDRYSMGTAAAATKNINENGKPRRHSRESGSDSSKDSSLQSDTSIESEDSFASVIYVPKTDQPNGEQHLPQSNCRNKPTSPLILPCPPTPMHSPAPMPTKNRLQSNPKETTRFTFDSQDTQEDTNNGKLSTTVTITNPNSIPKITTILTPPMTSSPDAIITSSSKSSLPKITRQTIKDLPPIPKFRHLSSFPIVRRISATKVVVPKFMSLELFNPETDDLDSDCDSSEPSSPDSIDSVINALQPPAPSSLVPSTSIDDDDTKSISPSIPLPPPPPPALNNSNGVPAIVEAAAVLANKLENTVEYVMRATTDYDNDINENNDRLYINKNDINLNVNINKPSDKIDNCNNDLTSDSDNFTCRQHLVDFAEKLSAQLLKELDENSDDNLVNDNNNDKHFSDEISDNAERVEQKLDKLLLNNLDDPYLKKINGEIKNLNQLREELRERRLMLANLSTMQQPTTCSQTAATKKPPPQTKLINFIPELDENVDDDNEINDIDHMAANSLKEMIRHDGYNTINSNSININNTHDTALLIQEEDSSDEHLHNDIDCSSATVVNTNKQNMLKIHHRKESNSQNHADNHNNNNNTNNNYTNSICNYASNINNSSKTTNNKPNASSFESNNSCESWANSNSTASLDSPSVGGGSATHHRYYHVFREGELDALINHHVTSLHIVSSYYERASWCVVCEKVQVWTI